MEQRLVRHLLDQGMLEGPLGRPMGDDQLSPAEVLEKRTDAGSVAGNRQQVHGKSPADHRGLLEEAPLGRG
jgi:hypothetical protein